MTQLTFQQGDPTWLAYRERAKNDLYWLNSVLLGKQEQVPMRRHAHDLLSRVAQGTTGSPLIDDAPYLLLLLPRDWGKSATVTQGLTIQALLRDPNTAVLLFNEKELTAAQFLEAIKHHFDQNDLFRALFPELIHKSKQDTQWSGTAIKIPRTTGRPEPSVMVAGVGAAIAGNHPDLIIVDDMISREASESARRGNWAIMEGVNRWTHTLEALLSNQSKHKRRLVFIGTHWFHNDCYDHLLQYFGSQHEPQEFLVSVTVENGRKQTLPVTRHGDLVVFKRSVMEDGQWSWPEKYDEDRMLRMQAEDPIFYAANFLNDPSTDATAIFRNDWLKTYQWLDSGTVHYTAPTGVKVTVQLQQCDLVLLVDPGGFGSGQDDRARAAIIVLAHTPTGEYLLLDAWSDKDTYVACQQRIVHLVRRYRPRKVGIEQAGQQIVFIDQVKRMLTEAGLAVAVEALKTDGKHKDDRILTLEPFFQRGLMYIGTGAAFTEFRTQYTQFPRSARRDLLDALAYFPKIVRPRSNALSGQERQQQERAQYYRKRGFAPGGVS